MDIVTIIGFILGPVAIIASFNIEGGNLKALYQLSGIIIMFGGSAAAILIGYGINQVKQFPKLFIELFIRPKSTVNKTIEQLVSLAKIARQSGLLSLEKAMSQDDPKNPTDPFLKRGVLMVVDGTEPEKINDILQNDIYVYEQSRNLSISMFEGIGGYGPAFGMVGTIMGLVNVLSAGMENPDEVTKSIGVAFVTTLYGVLLANLIFLPAASKLKGRLATYRLEKEMIIEGVCAIRNGVNPRVLNEQLSSYLVLEGKKQSGKVAAPEACKVRTNQVDDIFFLIAFIELPRLL